MEYQPLLRHSRKPAKSVPLRLIPSVGCYNNLRRVPEYKQQKSKTF